MGRLSSPMVRDSIACARCRVAAVRLVVLLGLAASGCATARTQVAPEPPPVTFQEQGFRFSRFDSVKLLTPDAPPSAVVLFIAGAEGFRGEARALGERLATRGAAVGAVELPPSSARNHGRRPNRACIYPAIDFQTLAKRIEKQLGFPAYVRPILVGYHESASIVVTALAETPPETFAGAVTLGFCPTLDLPVPACPGRGELRWEPDTSGHGGRILPGAKLPAPWVTVATSQASACSAEEVEAFVAATPGASLTAVDPATREAAEALASALTSSVLRLARDGAATAAAEQTALADLPLLEMPASAGSSDTLALMISGDGGWADLDQEVTEYWNQHGIPVVGWNSLRYFWSKRTPEETARALERVVRHYVETWGKRRVILAGYSQGAEILAYLTHRLPPDLLERIRAVALIAPGQRVEFEFHLSDWLSEGRETRGESVLPELSRLSSQRILCFEGEEERASLCPTLDPRSAQVVALPGGHHFAGDYAAIAKAVLESAP